MNRSRTFMSTPNRVDKVPIGKSIELAITKLANKNGSSVQAIKKYLRDHLGMDTKQKAIYIRRYFRSAVGKGRLIRMTGRGATGTFKLAPQKRGNKKTKPKPQTSLVQVKIEARVPKNKAEKRAIDLMYERIEETFYETLRSTGFHNED